MIAKPLQGLHKIIDGKLALLFCAPAVCGLKQAGIIHRLASNDAVVPLGIQRCAQLCFGSGKRSKQIDDAVDVRLLSGKLFRKLLKKSLTG